MWGIGEAIAGLLKTMVVLLAIFVPLGLWKAIEIVVWLVRNVSIQVL